MMNNLPERILWIVGIILFLPVLSVVAYVTAKAARYGWLRAEQLFFGNNFTDQGDDNGTN